MKGPSAIARAFEPTEGASYKLIYLARRRADIAAADFPRRWREHSRLASSFGTSLGSHFRSVHQCVVAPVEGADRLLSTVHDGSSILAMKSWPDLLAARYHPHALDELREDERRVFDGPVENCTMAVEETMLNAGETTDHVLLSFLARPAALGKAAFADASLAHARAIPDAADGIARLVWNRVIDPARSFAFAAVTEAWFDSRAALIKAARAPDYAERFGQAGIADLDRSVHLSARLNLAKATDGGSGDTAWSETG